MILRKVKNRVDISPQGFQIYPSMTNQFDLALCSHYLFLYSEHINFESHLAQILELCRVAKEVRIYPLVALDGNLSPHLSAVTLELEARSLTAQQIEVDYHFQKNATEMLVITPTK